MSLAVRDGAPDPSARQTASYMLSWQDGSTDVVGMAHTTRDFCLVVIIISVLPESEALIVLAVMYKKELSNAQVCISFTISHYQLRY